MNFERLLEIYQEQIKSELELNDATRKWLKDFFNEGLKEGIVRATWSPGQR